jgi:hypothetical protein
LTERIDPTELASEARRKLQQLTHELPEKAVKRADQVLRNLQQWLPSTEPGRTRGTRRSQGQASNGLQQPAVLNASGIAWRSEIIAGPTALAAIEEVASVLAGFREKEKAGDEFALLTQHIADWLNVGAACIAQRPSAALVALGRSLAERGWVAVVARQAAGEWNGAVIADLLRAGGATVREFGTAAGPQAGALQRMLPTLTQPWAYVACAASPADDYQGIVDGAECLNIARSQQTPDSFVVIQLGADPFCQLGGSPESHVGAQGSFVGEIQVIRPARWIGGPDCAVIAGRSQWIHSIERTDLWPALRAGTFELQMLRAIFDNASSGIADISPAMALGKTTAQNLALRGELIRDQLATLSGWEVRLAHAVARWFPDAGSMLPSCQVHLKPVGEESSGERLTEAKQRLLGGFPRVLHGQSDEELVLDLRWIPAADDALLVACLTRALGGKAERPESSQASS